MKDKDALDEFAPKGLQMDAARSISAWTDGETGANTHVFYSLKCNLL